MVKWLPLAALNRRTSPLIVCPIVRLSLRLTNNFIYKQLNSFMVIANTLKQIWHDTDLATYNQLAKIKLSDNTWLKVSKKSKLCDIFRKAVLLNISTPHTNALHENAIFP